MKKMICIVLTIMLLMTVLSGCGGNNYSSSNSSSTSADTYVAAEPTALSASEKETIAENRAIQAFASEWNNKIGWGQDGLRYNVGSVRNLYGSRYEVAGTWYWYDKYGSLQNYGTFSVELSVSDDGSCMIWDKDVRQG